MGINGGANNFSSDLAEFFNSITNIKRVEAAFNIDILPEGNDFGRANEGEI